jgi:hypothetical protein
MRKNKNNHTDYLQFLQLLLFYVFDVTFMYAVFKYNFFMQMCFNLLTKKVYIKIIRLI